MFSLYTVGAIEAGETYELYTVPKCTGDALLKVRGVNPIEENEYEFKGCGETAADYWKCPCNGYNVKIYLVTDRNTKNIYDIVLQYYLNAVDDTNVRTKNFNNINVNVLPKAKKESTTISFPEIKGSSITFIIIIIVGLIVSIIVVGILVYRWLFHDKNNMIDDDDVSYEDVIKYVDGGKKK